jgi:hypothetical protein
MNNTIFTSAIVKMTLFYSVHSKHKIIVTITGVKIVLFIYYGGRHNSTTFFLW